MRVHRSSPRGRSVRLLVVAAFVAALCPIVAPSGLVHAAEIDLPSRLYMAPSGELLPALFDVPVGSMPFDGDSDSISQQPRLIDVEVNDDVTCAPTEGNGFSLAGCSSVQMTVSHGLLRVGATPASLLPGSTTMASLPGGAFLREGAADYNADGGALEVAIVGNTDTLNASLLELVYTPDSGYVYTGSNPENMQVDLGPEGESPISGLEIQIRVLEVNDFPTLDPESPPDQEADPGVELVIDTPDPFYTVEDEDNDEIGDGAGDGFLLVAWMDCGAEIPLERGFHLNDATFDTIAGSVEELLTSYFGANEDAIAAIVAGLELLAPDIMDLEWTTSSELDYTDAFGAIGDIDALNDALANLYFLYDEAEATCTLTTVVSDLGNNGLPFQYIGAPPTGVEVPFPGFDWNELVIETGEVQTIEVGFTDPSAFVQEGETSAPTITISPATHPAFDLRIYTVDGSATDQNTDGDYSSRLYTDFTIAEDQTLVDLFTVDTNVFNDGEIEGPESFTWTMEFVDLAPVGWEVDVVTADHVVNIVDLDDPAATVSVSDDDVGEGDAGTVDLEFTVSLNQPADGTEEVTVETGAGGTATGGADCTTPGVDFVELAPQLLTFDPGETAQTVIVEVCGDLADEDDETVEVTLSNAVALGIADADGVGEIIDDDQTRTVTIGDVSQAEGDAGTSDMTFTLTLDLPAKGTETLMISTLLLPGGADATDLVEIDPAVPVDFVAGDDTATVDVVINGDIDDTELDEDFELVMSAPQNVVIGAAPADRATGTIENDDVAPTVVIEPGATQDDPTNTSPIVFDVTFDKAVTGFDGTDIDFTGSTAGGALAATVSPGAGPASVYEVSVTGMTTPGLVVAGVVDGAAIDGASRPSEPSPDTAQVAWDATAPTVTLTQHVDQDDPTDTPPIVFVVEFSEPVTGFGVDDIDLTTSTAGGTLAAAVSGAGADYTVTITGMTTGGDVIVTIDDGAATDAAGNASAPYTSPDNTVEWILAPLTVTVEQQPAQPDPTSASPISFVVTFSRPVTGFVASEVDLSASTAGGPLVATIVPVAEPAAVYEVEVTGMSSDGDVIATVGVDVARDLFDLPNPLSTSTDNVVEYAVAADPLTIDVPDDVTVPNDPGLAGATVTYPDPTSTGGVEPVIVTCTPASGTFFPIGVTNVACSATDSEDPQLLVRAALDAGPQALVAELTVSDSFTVTVVDVEPPVIDDGPDLSFTSPTNSISVTFATPDASDNSGVPPTVTCTAISGAVFPLGVSTVTCTATDGAGNTASSSFTITVVMSATNPPGVPPSGTPGGTPTTPPGGQSPSGFLPQTGGAVRSIPALGSLLLVIGAALVATKRIGRTTRT